MILVGLTGVARSGKDTVGKILCDELGFERRAFADKLRAVALGADPMVATYETDCVQQYERLSTLVDAVGWESAKNFADVRGFLQRLGTEGVRKNLDRDAWVDSALREFGLPFSMRPDRVVFTDVRFQNEAEAIIDGYGGEVWLIKRPGFEPVNAHASESGLPPELVSRVIENDGSISQLKAKVLGSWSLA